MSSMTLLNLLRINLNNCGKFEDSSFSLRLDGEILKRMVFTIPVLCLYKRTRKNNCQMSKTIRNNQVFGLCQFAPCSS